MERLFIIEVIGPRSIIDGFEEAVEITALECANVGTFSGIILLHLF